MIKLPVVMRDFMDIASNLVPFHLKLSIPEPPGCVDKTKLEMMNTKSGVTFDKLD